MPEVKNCPAFPTPFASAAPVVTGLTKREYAAILLRVPDSGEEWLDKMIEKSNVKEHV